MSNKKGKDHPSVKLVFKAIGLLVVFLLVFVLIMNKVKLNSVSKRLISLPRKPAGPGGHWMANLPPEIKKQPITKLKIVGTHDAHAYQLIDYKLPGTITGKIKWAHANSLQKYVGLGKEFISDWTLTQNKDIFTQLCQGVRAFDLRVTFDTNSGRFIYSHSLACDFAENILDQIADFIKFHPHELIFLWSKPDWEHKDSFSNEAAVKYVELVKNKLGPVLIPYHSGDLKSLHDYTNVGKKNVFFMMDPLGTGGNPVAGNPFVWDYGTIKNQWNPTIDRNELYRYNLELVRSSQALSNRLTSIGITMSPDNTVIVQELKKRWNPFRKNLTLKEFSQPIQDQYAMLLRDTNKEKIGNINIWWTDFPTDTFINTVIQSNY